MSMNVPPENNNEMMNEQPPVEPTMEQPTMEQPTQQTQEAPTAEDAQVINQVAEGLAEDAINATDILAAVLSDSLGISPAGGYSLAGLLEQEILNEAQADADVDMNTMESPQEPME